MGVDKYKHEETRPFWKGYNEGIDKGIGVIASFKIEVLDPIRFKISEWWYRLKAKW